MRLNMFRIIRQMLAEKVGVFHQMEILRKSMCFIETEMLSSTDFDHADCNSALKIICSCYFDG